MKDELKSRGCFAVYNHPYWSCVTPEDMGLLEGFAAIEVYNHGCEADQGISDSSVFWDLMLRAGSRVNAVAADDSHNEFPDGKPESDAYGGWICVNAPELTRNVIAEAIIAGRYYSSNGPAIKNYGVRNGKVFVECDPVHHVRFVSGALAKGQCVWAQDRKDSLGFAEYTLSEHDPYVRIECINQYGKKAWSNPIFPE
jgi:hypothetical protein